MSNLNPVGSQGHSWNYSRPDDDGYATSLTGTVAFIQMIQASKYNPNRKPGQRPVPDFWDNGDPKMNIRMGMALADGSLRTLVFSPAGAKARKGEKPSLHMDLFAIAGGRDMMDLIGKTIMIETWPAHPQTGMAWGNGNPRLWNVQEVPGVQYQLAQPLDPEYRLDRVLLDEGAHGGQPTPPAPQQIQVPQAPQYNAGTATVAQPGQTMYNAPQPMAAPGVQPGGMYPAPQPVQQFQPAQPMQTAQAMQPPVPAGMDPAVAAAMQSVGAVNVQPVTVDASQSVPYEDVPF